MPKQSREPIISVLGHVDHGKTTILDQIRRTTIASGESGGITQHIGATDVPFDAIQKICGTLLKDVGIKLQDLLFVDTPGHEAFTNLRKRGGSVADLAILVIDINEGLKPQTIESIEIIKHYRTPFVVAANKIDIIGGWMPGIGLDNQMEHVKDEFYKKFYFLIHQLSQHNFDSDLYSNITDFTRQIAIVPVSAKTEEGIPELLMVLIGLAQQYLGKKLEIGLEKPAKGTILDVKEEKGLGTTIDVIIYDGHIKKDDWIVVGAKTPILTKVKALLRPKPLDELRDPKYKFSSIDEVYAAAGIKIVAPNLENAIAGAPVYVGGSDLIEKVKKEVESVEISTNKLGIIVKADTLGSLEAVIRILSSNDIPIRKGMIGGVTRGDVMEASAVRSSDKYLGVIWAFNSQISKEAEDIARDKNIKIFGSDVIYRLLEEYSLWKKQEMEIEKAEKLKKAITPVKIKLLPKYVFRQSNPAIVGIEILVGKLSSGCRLMRDDGRVVGRVKGIQLKKETVKSAKVGDEVAISIEGVTIGRQLMEGDVVYSFISDEDMAKLNLDELSAEEIKILEDIRELKAKRY